MRVHSIPQVPFLGDRPIDLYLPACPPTCPTMVGSGLRGWRWEK